MREIRFRVWDRYIKSMVDDPKIGYLEGKYSYSINEEISYKIDEGSVFMQYTGLKDKNGVEIYEGDIVDCTKQWDDDSYNATTRVVVNDIRGIPSELYFGSYRGERVVVGNIYENPELLTDRSSNLA